MNKITNILISFTLLVICTASCETYNKKYKQEFSPIYPLCGEWRISITDNTTKESEHAVIFTYDTANKEKNVMWLWINLKYGTRCKIECDVANCTFSGKKVENQLRGGTSDIEGKVIVNSATTPSGGTEDSIEMTYYSSVTGHSYTISGFRRTGWGEGE